MITCLMGHRGTGKTSLLQRIESYYQESSKNVICIDLDSEIEKYEKKKISDIFTMEGEKSFRILEERYLNELIQKLLNHQDDIFISLGAGFQAEIPKNVPVIKVTRPSDKVGRIFLNRPRLEPQISPLEEFKKRFHERKALYQKYEGEDLILMEGFQTPNLAERLFFTNQIKNLEASLTLLPKHFSSKEFWNDFINKRLLWGIKYFELRDDILTTEQIELAKVSLPSEQILFSLRTKNSAPQSYKFWDWALELGTPPSHLGTPPVVSIHEMTQKGFKPFENKSHLKWAPIITSFKELYKGHLWWLEDKKNRSFLPRSLDGRWNWYRLLMKNTLPINYIREDEEGSSMDQPTLLEWVNHQGLSSKEFAAILGDPVTHSWTCAEQDSFFRQKHLPVLRITLTKNDWEEGALDILRLLGLRYAAVTSPLKELAFQSSSDKTDAALQFKSVNTLYWDNTKKIWTGHNTDIDGLKVLFKELTSNMKMAVWGGGGTLSQIEYLLPQAHFFSARTGKNRKSNSLNSDFDPEIIIWASGWGDQLTFPPDNWNPKKVIDLNYTENSPGLEYAYCSGAIYTSGKSMFKTQAQAQRDFWSKNT